MFDEIENEKEPLKEERKIFDEDNISNKEIGKKIKLFAKIFFKIQKYFLIIFVALAIIGVFASLENFRSDVLLAFIMIGLTAVVLITLAYYGFLLISGFGALIEDVHAIKESVTKGNKTKVTKKIADKKEEL